MSNELEGYRKYKEVGRCDIKIIDGKKSVILDVGGGNLMAMSKGCLIELLDKLESTEDK